MQRRLDHVGVAVADLERGRAQYARLGFRLTERSLHAGARTAGGPIEPWGSGNHCAMLGDGYLEIIGITDPAKHSSVKDLVARYEGPHIVAIGCGDADAAFAALSAARIPVESPRALERDAPFGTDGRETRRAKFRNIYVDRQAYPEARFLYIEHLTPEVLWQPHLTVHPNGALALEAVYFIAADVGSTARKLAALFAPGIDVPAGAGVVALPLARGTAWVTDATNWRERTPGSFAPPAPAPAGFGIRVESLDRTRALLEANGVAVHAGMRSRGPASIWVAPEDACGAAVQFLQAEQP